MAETHCEQHGWKGRVLVCVNHGEKFWQVPLSGPNKEQSENIAM